jgi:DNA-binding FadR family transcriptional regulator
MSLYGSRGVHGQTVETIARRVLSGQLPEGATIDLTGLQAELDVSLTALRESLKVLAAKGLVDARQKRGTFVRPRTDWNLLDPDVLRWRFSAEPDVNLLRSLHEVRGIIEPAAVRLAAERRTDEDLDRLDKAIAAMAEAAEPPGAVEADLAFHHALLEATHNELLTSMQTVLESALAARDQLVHGTARHSDDPVPSHRAVLDGVRAEDPDAAEAAMRSLLDKAVSDEDLLQAGADAA